MHEISLDEIRNNLSKKQQNRFKELLEQFRDADKIDILGKLAKKRILLVRRL